MKKLCKKIVVANDFQIPFHDRKLLKLFNKFLKYFKPSLLIINGDLLDCWMISDFDKTPKTGMDFSDELKLGYQVLKDWRRIMKDKEIWYIEGNHEWRLKKYINRIAPELFGLLSLPELLKLKELNIRWIGTNKLANKWIDTYVKIGDIYVGHYDKVNRHSGYTAKNLVDYKGVSLIQGHVHRGGVHYRRTLNSQQITAIENFCMCSLNPNYISEPNWQQGFSVIYLESKKTFVYPIHIKDYEFYWADKKFEV